MTQAENRLIMIGGRSLVRSRPAAEDTIEARIAAVREKVSRSS
jgi:hypothetical protein